MAEAWREQLQEWLMALHFGELFSEFLASLTLLAGSLAFSLILFWISRLLLKTLLAKRIEKSRNKWDDKLLKRRVFHRLTLLIPAITMAVASALVGELQDIVQRGFFIWITAILLMTLCSILDAADDIYRQYDVSRHKPIKGYLQVVKIVLYVIAGIIIVSFLINRSPVLLLSGIGALSAVLMVVFKDSLLGLVAGIQLTANDMVRIGDWVEMPKYAADGDVIDITLHTIKISNWDRTITTIPAYAMISDSFKNWRGMSEAGGRRIKRAIRIDMNSIRFCNPEMLTRFKKIRYISDYLEKKEQEIEQYNAANGYDADQPVNGRHLTNIGTFRAYVLAYLSNHPDIRQDFTLIVRQLEPGDNGLPLEIYCFTNTTVWARYEAIQSDIFDHLLSILPLFDLRVFQQPAGTDLAGLQSPDTTSGMAL